MKKTILFLLLFLLLICHAEADSFTLDDKVTINGMNGVSWYQGYAPSEQNDRYTICLPIRCEGAVGRITAQLALNDPNQLVFRNPPQPVNVSAQNGIYPVRISVPLAQNRRNGDYPASVTLSGRTSDGSPVTQVIPCLVSIRSGEKNQEILRPEISLSGELRVGEDCTLELTLRNPAASLAMTHVELTLTDNTREVLMTGSDRIAVDDLLPGQTIQRVLPITVKGTAAIETHQLACKLCYQLLEENATWEEVISYPVTQEIQLEVGSFSLPNSVVQGDVSTLSLPLMNLGKGDLRNAMVALEFPGLISRQSVLVGTIEPGATGQAKLTFTPGKDALGDYSGTIRVSCEDRYGNTASWSSPVQITVEAAKPTVSLEAGAESAAPPVWILPTLAAACVLLLSGLITQGALLRGKLHKLEEEKL